MSENTLLLENPTATEPKKAKSGKKEEKPFSFSSKLKDMRAAIGTVTTILSGKSTLPIVGHIHVTAEDNRVGLYVNNLEIAIRAEVAATVKSPGITTIPGKQVSDFLKTFGDDKEYVVAIESNGNKTRVAAAQSQVNYSSFNPDDYPKLELCDTPHELPAKQLAGALKQCLSAASKDETRLVMAGVYLEQENGALKVVATDGRRLHIAAPDMKINQSDKAFMPLILPLSSVKAILKILDSVEGDANPKVSFGSNDKSFSFKYGPYLLVSRVIEGSFPQYGKVIPKDDPGTSTLVKVSRKEMLTAVRRVSLSATTGVKILLKTNQMFLLSRNGSTTESEEIIDLKYEGQEFAIGANADFLTDALESLNGEVASLVFRGPINPITLQEENAASFMAVIMPMKAE